MWSLGSVACLEIRHLHWVESKTKMLLGYRYIMVYRFNKT